MAEYQLEYGSDKIEMHVGAIREGQRVVLLDDLIATGGTLAAGIELMRKVRASTSLTASTWQQAKLPSLDIFILHVRSRSASYRPPAQSAGVLYLLSCRSRQ